MLTEKDCLFCKIISGELPSKKVYEDDELFAFYDIEPSAPVHVLLVPKDHFKDVVELAENRPVLLDRIVKVAKDIATELTNGEFRLTFNTGSTAFQRVFHVHAHVQTGFNVNLS